MKKLHTTALAALVLALALLAAGCGSADQRSSNRVQLGLATDSAYLAVLTAQNTNAANYSQAIARTRPSKAIDEFAHSVIAARNDESKEIAKLQKDDPASADLSEAADQLGITLSKLAISADGKPLASPSTEAAYVKAMISNDKAAIRASNAEIDSGSPGVVPFAKNVVVQRTDELASLKDLQ